ncbi:MAG: glycyl-radical enzyme activating protein [Lachnospiraceae bacterium]|nr:glycyl-radical enzyme activating protein [Lachnospiraceae bacterium]
MSANALVTNIQGYSIHDGPGIRTVVFLKGCPLRCKWCANPENLEGKLQVGWISKLCTGCGRCAKTCRFNAIIPGDGQRINREACTRCGECVDTCFYKALVRYGEEMTAEEVFAKVRRDKMFYDTSGGGVTVSGGEPLVHPEFVTELFTYCRGEQIHTCIETCGCVPQKAFEIAAPVTDLFYFDLKIADPEIHRQYTGTDNEQILSNARYLAGTGANILFRQPLIPGINDTDANIEGVSAFIRSLGRSDLALQLMPYHRMGLSKYAALDKPYELEEIQIMKPEEIEEIRGRYEALGISCSISK